MIQIRAPIQQRNTQLLQRSVPVLLQLSSAGDHGVQEPFLQKAPRLGSGFGFRGFLGCGVKHIGFKCGFRI